MSLWIRSDRGTDKDTLTESCEDAVNCMVIVTEVWSLQSSQRDV